MESFVCTHCGSEMPSETLTAFDDQRLCPDCVADLTRVCCDCGERIWSRDNFGSGSRPLCQNCFDEDYETCEDCGRVIYRDDACYSEADSAYYCGECYARHDRGPIEDYYYKPVPIFYGDGPRYFGVELEIDQGGELGNHAELLLDIANREQENLYCKHDGSLEDGFELVTHPMSLYYQLNVMPWGEILSKAASLGYRSHQANTCGLHVHVSRAAFGKTPEQQEDAIGRVLFFVERHWNELLRFSRRTPHQLEQWAARYGYKDHPKEMLEHAKKGARGRYACVNLTNFDTIEFRIFRGTLKLNTFLATLQLVDHICDVAIFMSDEQLRELSWSSFVSGIGEPELVRYLKERRLYVNDPLDVEVDI